MSGYIREAEVLGNGDASDDVVLRVFDDENRCTTGLGVVKTATCERDIPR